MQTTDPSNLFRTETALAEEEARKKKRERTKTLGEPIDLPGIPLDVILRDNDLWVAESAAVIRKLDIETGSVLQVYNGHKGPVTSIYLLDSDGKSPLLISGSWDKSIKVWNTKSKTVLSTTSAHADFVKCLLVIPGMKLLVSGGSDQYIRFWDISDPTSTSALPSLGYLSEHTRPLQCLAVDSTSVSATSCILYSADSMGVIKVWNIERTYGADGSSCRGSLRQEIGEHRTGVNDMWFGDGKLWTASTDETVRVQESYVSSSKPSPPLILQHPKPVKALLPLSLALATTPAAHVNPGIRADHIDDAEPYLLTAFADTIRAYDLSLGDPFDPDILGEVDGHWHDVTALRAWLRKKEGQSKVELWIISASLDGTVRKWKFSDFASPSSQSRGDVSSRTPAPAEPIIVKSSVQLTEEEEEELAELMESD